MSDIIQLLPDSVANQIAAGEVIQRPASVVKELMENAIDAGATSITVRLKDAGKTYVQVIDNGQGMSENDARLCFERHATSKISSASDLFAIRTMGFRGEALASIAAISEISLKTRQASSELGIHSRVSGSKMEYFDPESTPAGTNIMVRNLFFNVPARRKFLKSDQTELRHAINEFNHVALAYDDIEFQFIHNNTQVYTLPPDNLKKRISGMFGKPLLQHLIPVSSETSIVTIRGFIGKAEAAKKTYGEQFFFVNRRFMKHPYFHKAVMQAYEEILPPEYFPSYFIFFEIDPAAIDINIHPTKTEIKFEDERAIWQILKAAVREAIGKNNLSPSLDFSREGVIDIPVLKKDTEVSMPRDQVNPAYNPFDADGTEGGHSYSRPRIDPNWQKLFDQKNNDDLTPGLGFESEKEQASALPEMRYLQLKNRYILTPVKSGLMMIDQRRAHERILYEQNLELLRKNAVISQKSLFPETIELSAADYQVCKEIIDKMAHLGFDVRDFGKNTVIVHSLPANAPVADVKTVIETLIEQYKSLEGEIKLDVHEKLARSSAVATAVSYGKSLDSNEMRELVDQLFACSNPNTTPSGKAIIALINLNELEKHLA
jgi:DNA mismatch repair protein MutL